MIDQTKTHARSEGRSARTHGRKNRLHVLDHKEQKGAELMGGMNFRDAYEFDPDTYGGGLPGMLRRAMLQQGSDFGSTPNATPEYNSSSNDGPQGGLLGRFLALQAEQSRYQPVASDSGQTPSVSQNPNFRQLSRVPGRASLPMPGSRLPPAGDSAPQAQAQYEADQAQQARDAAAARLARSVRNLTRAEAPPPDPVDIAKSAAIGFVNGAVNAVGLPADALTGFGFFPDNLVANGARRLAGYPEFHVDASDWIRDRFSAAPIQHWLEGSIGTEFYKPESRAGRFAETIGEMVPMVLGGEVAGVRVGAQTADAALRELPGTLAKHAIAPGIAVQAIQETLPDSHVGQTVQKAYPVLRRVLPAGLAAKHYLSGQIVPQ